MPGGRKWIRNINVEVGKDLGKIEERIGVCEYCIHMSAGLWAFPPPGSDAL